MHYLKPEMCAVPTSDITNSLSVVFVRTDQNGSFLPSFAAAAGSERQKPNPTAGSHVCRVNVNGQLLGGAVDVVQGLQMCTRHVCMEGEGERKSQHFGVLGRA